MNNLILVTVIGAALVTATFNKKNVFTPSASANKVTASLSTSPNPARAKWIKFFDGKTTNGWYRDWETLVLS